MPLIQKDTYCALLDKHRSENNACTLLTGSLDEKMPYGRIVRNASGGFERIVEQKDCTEQEDGSGNTTAACICFDCASLLGTLKKMNNENAHKMSTILRTFRGY